MISRYDITTIAADGAFEQVADCGVDLCLGIVFAVEWNSSDIPHLLLNAPGGDQTAECFNN